jgi:sterol desaturase/sphingolipid hydroxylase (fatty acid hydroxylase superfamily)
MKDRKDRIRVFESDILESLTYVHPIVPLIVWLPLVIFLIWYSQITFSPSFAQWAVGLVGGLLVVTFSEYFLHRVIFHYKAKSKFGKRLVWIFHGLHHDDPKDPLRLVMPPVPAIIIMTALYLIFRLFIPENNISIFMAGFIVGYLCYDYIHYASHHFKMKNGYWKYIKMWHLNHHYVDQSTNYGVSTSIWDYVFKTIYQSREEIQNYEEEGTSELQQDSESGAARIS